MNIDINKANPLAFVGLSETEIKAELERRALLMAEYEKYRETTPGLVYADSILIYNVSQKAWDNFAKNFTEFKRKEIERKRNRKITCWTWGGVIAATAVAAVVIVAKSK